MARRSRQRMRPAEEVPPHAGRMTSALTGLDYDFERAVADIVDNSITAEAKDVWIEIRSHPRFGAFVLIVDNGSGMTERELVSAMQYGAESPKGQDGLGKFGLGMKTASTSQAGVVSVASRGSPRGNFAVRAWDLGYLEGRETWTLLKGDVAEFPVGVNKRLRASTGTAVLWTELVRALPNERLLTESALDKVLNDFARDTIDHLSLVFNRFLSGNTTGRRRHVRIWVNGVRVKSRDPLLREHENTRLWRRKSFVIRRDDGQNAEFYLQPAILPRQEQFVDSRGEFDREAHKRAGGPRGWNAGQGLYIYRRDRLIQGGGWCYLRAADEHSKTARIDVDLTDSSDELFRLNVSKTRILLPKVIKDEIRDYTARVVSEAKKAYGKHHGGGRKKKRAAAKRGGLPNHGPRLVLNTLLRSCKTVSERRILLRIIGREYPGYKPPRA